MQEKRAHADRTESARSTPAGFTEVRSLDLSLCVCGTRPGLLRTSKDSLWEILIFK